VKAYSMDLRTRVLADRDRGMRTKAVAAKYDVSPAWVRRLLQVRRETGGAAPRVRAKAPAFHERHGELLRAEVARLPDGTLEALAATLREAHGLPVSVSNLWLALRALKIAFKKKSSAPPSRSARTSPRNGPPGGRPRRASTRAGWSSSTRPGPPPR
jgi:transposase